MSWFKSKPYYPVNYSLDESVAIYELGVRLRAKAFSLAAHVYENQPAPILYDLMMLSSELAEIGSGRS